VCSRRRRALAIVVALFALAAPASVRAADLPAGSVGSLPQAGGDSSIPIEQRPVPYKPLPILDPRLSPRSGFLLIGVAAVPVPPATGNGHERGLTLAIGDGIRTQWGVAFVELERSLRLTAPRWSDISVRLPCYTMSGGLTLGPAELELGGGLSFFGFDWLDDGVAFSFLSPGASARATIVFDRVRASVVASTEYLWRWFDRRDVVLNALSLQIAIVNPPSRRFGTHPLDVQE
jgi:hypothetical protein